MGTWQPGPPPSASAARIRQPAFRTVFRGYDPKQVVDYLSGVADRVEALESNVSKLESELHEARRQGIVATAPGDGGGGVSGEIGGRDPYDGISARVADLVRTFDQDVERLRAEAEAEVERLVAEARTQGERLLADARTEAERLRLDAEDKAAETRARAERTLREAKDETDQALSALTARRDALVNELRSMRDHMLDTAKDLESTIESSMGDSVLVLREASGNESAEATSINSPDGQPDASA